jgi:crotonobetainyl-CoA:carnitine CoA-transferase CaiB-like acyl-CoA transferase
VVPLFEVLNNKFREAFSKFTRAELEERFHKHDVWWCPVNTVAEAKSYVQTRLLKVVQGERKGKERVSAPFYLSV